MIAMKNTMISQMKELDSLLENVTDGHPPKLFEHYTSLLDEKEKDAFVVVMIGKLIENGHRLKRIPAQQPKPRSK
jgi:hypothetical protein